MGKVMTVKKGDTIRKRLLLKYIGTSSPVNLTGVAGYSQLRATPKGPLMAEGDVAIDATAGAITVTYQSAQTAGLSEGNYGFDIRIETDGDVKTIYTKEVKIINPYTELE